jgi:hypothetical protein
LQYHGEPCLSLRTSPRRSDRGMQTPMIDDLFAPLDALGPSRRARSRPVNSISYDEGPFDRHITTNRRLSLTALLPGHVDKVSVRRTVSGIIVSSDVAAGIILTVQWISGRREIWLRGQELRKLVPSTLQPRRDRHGWLHSVPVDVYRRMLFDQGIELEVVPRGAQRSL